MDKAEQTMLNNLALKTGKTLEQWVEIISRENFDKYSQIVKFLKENHQFTHGFANLVAHKTLKTDAASAESEEDLVAQQYLGKEHLKPILDFLLQEIGKLGDDIIIAPKKSYISIRRKKQFAMLQAATKTRFEIGINLKNQDATGILEKVTTKNAMCSHKIHLTSIDEINDETLNWLKAAYENAS